MWLFYLWLITLDAREQVNKTTYCIFNLYQDVQDFEFSKISDIQLTDFWMCSISTDIWWFPVLRKTENLLTPKISEQLQNPVNKYLCKTLSCNRQSRVFGNYVPSRLVFRFDSCP